MREKIESRNMAKQRRTFKVQCDEMCTEKKRILNGITHEKLYRENSYKLRHTHTQTHANNERVYIENVNSFFSRLFLINTSNKKF